MSPLPREADLAAGLDLAFLGSIALGGVQFGRAVSSVPAGTPALLRLGGTSAASTTAPELGLLSPGGESASPLGLEVTVAEPTRDALTLVTLAVVVGGPLWHWVVKPYAGSAGGSLPPVGAVVGYASRSVSPSGSSQTTSPAIPLGLTSWSR